MCLTAPRASLRTTPRFISFPTTIMQAHALLAAAKLAHLMKRVLIINSSSPWAFSGCLCSSFLKPLPFTF
jgi:hypothetical protein